MGWIYPDTHKDCYIHHRLDQDGCLRLEDQVRTEPLTHR